MTRESFIEVLDDKGYSYSEEGGKIVVDHQGSVYLESLTSIPEEIVFSNEGSLNLKSLTSIPEGIVFSNRGDLYLKSLTGDWVSYWSGIIDGIDSKRLLNVMISEGLFDRDI